jgi:hypothetical protein
VCFRKSSGFVGPAEARREKPLARWVPLRGFSFSGADAS